jgi:hypothetical protein
VHPGPDRLNPHLLQTRPYRGSAAGGSYRIGADRRGELDDLRVCLGDGISLLWPQRQPREHVLGVVREGVRPRIHKQQLLLDTDGEVSRCAEIHRGDHALVHGIPIALKERPRKCALRAKRLIDSVV